MKYHLFIITILAAFLAPAFADVEITSPEEGDKFSGSSGTASIKVSWKDNSDSDSDTSLDNVKSYTLSLCTNGSPIQCQDPAIKQKELTSKSTTVTVKQDDVPSGYYFIQVYTLFTGGSSSINYTPRFQLTNMDGPTGTLVVTVTGDQPDGQTSASQASSVDVSKSVTVPYTLQTGKTRYAPMQSQPGSTVTATTWSMQYPSSAVTYYSTKHSKPVVYSTVTPGWSYTASSEVNWATVAPYPTNWYAASERKLSKASMTATQKKRRWIE
ncbi:KRE9 [Candida margitis]|uniref:KRE9 n=1 Tax=Candida margitis TaxID=1775924 RepID=UPI0022274DE4|nr:KRE9 [Candida margitis]KAI5970630.1 KRE9 [Candida margitis]